MAEVKKVAMNVPAAAEFARTLRMTASSLAVSCDMSVDDVEDVRIAVDEGFVYTCATRPASVDVSFTLSDGSMAIDFALGSQPVSEVTESGEPVSIDLVELLLSAVCDEFGVNEAGTVLHLLKRSGGADV